MTAKQEYDWESLRAEINARFSGAGMVKRPYAQFALFVYLTGNVNGMHLLYAGFTDVNWNNRTLSYWRRDNFLPPGDTLDAQTLTAKFPEIADLLPRLQAGEFNAQPVIHTKPQLSIQPQVEEVSMQPQPTATAPEPPLTAAGCQKTAGCKRNGPFPHAGHCSTLTPEERKAKQGEYEAKHRAKLAAAKPEPKQKRGRPVVQRESKATKSQALQVAASVPVIPLSVTTVDAPRSPAPDERVAGRFRFHFAPDDGSDRLEITISGRASVSRNEALGLMGNMIDSEQPTQTQQQP